MMQIPQHGVVLEQMRQRLCIRQVVYRYKVDVGIAERRAKDVTTNAAESIDANLDCHSLVSFSILFISRRSAAGSCFLIVLSSPQSHKVVNN